MGNKIRKPSPGSDFDTRQVPGHRKVGDELSAFLVLPQGLCGKNVFTPSRGHEMILLFTGSVLFIMHLTPIEVINDKKFPLTRQIVQVQEFHAQNYRRKRQA